jgi:hypothetical protein
MTSVLDELSRKRKNDANLTPTTKKNKVKSDATEIGIHVIFTGENENDPNKIIQAIIIQDNFNLKNFYQTSACNISTISILKFN